MLKSPIGRIGGKAMLTNWLKGFIPEHTCYVEPFCGSASLLFGKEPSWVEVLNDIDKTLVNLYRCIQNPAKRSKLVEMLQDLPYSRQVFNDLKYGTDTPADDIELAARYFYLSRASFAGDTVRGGFAVPSVTGRNPARSYQNAINSLEAVASRLRGVTIECLPYNEVIRRYDSPSTFFYIDPPYLESEHYYGDGFTVTDHFELAAILHQVKGKAMVSHYDNDVYRSLYQDFNCYHRRSFKGAFKSSGEKKPKTVECVWTNYRPARTRTLFEG
ncbi:MAG: DNA adenine methylase [Candidatus Kuenenia sp.]|nr:DNA adenine methylase [Candidatus Kuenenia hertensis]